MYRLHTVAWICILSGIAAFQSVNAGKVPTIITNSPFLPPGFQPPGTGGGGGATPPAAVANQYELRGVYQLDGRFYYNLYDRRERKGSWMTEQEASEKDVRILDFDTEENTLRVSIGGEDASISMVSTSNQPMPIQSAPRPNVRAGASKAAANEPRRPVRRRVIRPTVRPASDSPATDTARRRVINRRTPNP